MGPNCHALKCPVLLLVVTLDAKVANWARTPVVIVGPSFFKMTPVTAAQDHRRGDQQDQQRHRRSVL
jgi:hypothetical protein